jgi:hypothetical protein
MSWDALPSDTEAEEINPLLARIQELKNAAKRNSMGLNSWFSSFNNEFSHCRPKFKAMDVFGYDKPFPSVQEGSNDKGTQEQGQINDHVDY